VLCILVVPGSESEKGPLTGTIAVSCFGRVCAFLLQNVLVDEMKKDNMKLAFVTQHFNAESPFIDKRVMDVDVQRALSWAAGKEPQEIMRYREGVVSTLEAISKQQWLSGECDAWLDDCEHGARDVVKGVNGPMLTDLAKAAAYNDLEAIDAFKTGASFYGVLDVCSIGEQIEYIIPEPMDELYWDCERSNHELLEQLKTSEHADELLELTRADAKLGRMTMPVPIEEIELDKIRLCPRFAVVQGEQDDGKPKIRPVDHFSWSAPAKGKRKRIGKKAMKSESVNGHTAIPEKIKYDHIDDFLFVIQAFLQLGAVSIASSAGRWLVSYHSCVFFCDRYCLEYGRLISRQPSDEFQLRRPTRGQRP
jgi:hypothetical protein